jgi:hypothetical protein
VNTKLFQILSKVRRFDLAFANPNPDCVSDQMPKGALLHAHLDATVNAKFLLQLALKQPALHVRVPQVITSLTLSSTLPEFRALPREQFSEVPSLTDGTYEPGSWVALQRARETFDASLGGPEGFDNWVIGAMMINPTEAYNTHNTIAKVWIFILCLSMTDWFLFSDMGKIYKHFHCINGALQFCLSPPFGFTDQWLRRGLFVSRPFSPNTFVNFSSLRLQMGYRMLK